MPNVENTPDNEWFENSLDSIPEPTAEDLLSATVSIHDIVSQVSAEYIAATIQGDTPVAEEEIDTHPDGHMFNRVRGVMFCACDCELCSAPAPVGKHFPECICSECECDG